MRLLESLVTLLFAQCLANQCPSETNVQISGTMDGALQVNPGETVYAGYDFTIPGFHSALLSVSVASADVTFWFRCRNGNTVTPATFSLPLPNQAYSVTNQNWYPSGDQNSAATYQSGPVTIPDLCNGRTIDDSQGATLHAVVSASEVVSKINFRFHYGVHMNSGWSGTVGVAPYPPCTPVCDPNCATCSGPASTQCTSCNTGDFLSGGSCFACVICSGGTFQSATCTATSDSSCSPCDSSCLTCNGFGPTSCTSCPDTSFERNGHYYPMDFFLNNGSCSQCDVCPAGTFESTKCSPTSDTVCSACDSSCATCTGPGPGCT